MHLADRHIRRALHRSVVPDILGDDPDGFALDEMGLCGHRARIDIAVFNGVIHGIEIKSDRDSLTRLPEQAVVYGGALDKVTLAVGQRYAAKAQTVIPDWWGVVVAEDRGGEVGFTQEREASPNPDPHPLAVAQLLWREEALEELALRGYDRGYRTKARRHIWQRLAEVVAFDELRNVVRCRIKSRPGFQAGGRRE